MKIANLIKNYRAFDYLILLIILAFGMWPLLSGAATMKWDAMDIYLPWKYYTTECIRNGYLPLWNPFMNSGFPQMGDVNTWYPLSWIIALFGRYNATSLHFEYLVHLYIAGVGMYKVAQRYSLSRPTGIVLASSYMLSGFFISNAQHVGWLVSAAWFPFIYYYFAQLHTAPRLATAAKLAFSAFMMFSGGYPGIFISTFYIVLAITGYTIFRFVVRKEFYQLKRWMLFASLSAVFFMLLSAVVILCSLDLSRHVIRGGGLPFDNSAWGVLTGSLPPRAVLTFLFPYGATINNADFWKTDFSIINCYMGLIPLLLVSFAVFRKEIPHKARIFIVVGVLFMLTAFAQEIPIRKWLYMYLPFMNLFRFSALFRIFAIFFFLLAAGFMFDHIRQNAESVKKFFRFLPLGLVGFIALEFFLIFKTDTYHISALFHGIAEFDKLASIKEKMFSQGLLQIGFIVVALLIFEYRPKLVVAALVVLSCADMVLATRLNLYATVVSDYPVKKLNEAFAKFPDGYPLPSLKVPMIKTNNDALRGSIPYLWQNLAIYHKLPSMDGNSPYSLYTMSNAMKSKNYYTTLEEPLLFLASFKTGEAVIDTNSIDKKSSEAIHITRFNPNRIDADVTVTKEQYLVFQQNCYPYWRTTVNNQEQAVVTANETYISAHLVPGNNKVSIEFRPIRIIIAFYVSVICFIVFVGYFGYENVRELVAKYRR
jgi:hypothetical protein